MGMMTEGARCGALQAVKMARGTKENGQDMTENGRHSELVVDGNDDGRERCSAHSELSRWRVDDTMVGPRLLSCGTRHGTSNHGTRTGFDTCFAGRNSGALEKTESYLVRMM